MGRIEAKLATVVGIFFIAIAIIAVMNSPTDLVAWVAAAVVGLVGVQTLAEAARRRRRA